MSCDGSVKTGSGRRGFLTLAVGTAMVAVTCLVSACQPLYVSNDQVDVTDEFSKIRISPLRDRAGQLFHNFLRDRLNISGQPSQPDYQLDTVVREQREDVGLRQDETATRANLNMSVEYRLIDYHTGETLAQGVVRSSSSFDILENQYASDVSEDNARERSLRDMAESVRRRMGIYFSNAAN